jgi:hypothetical protein
MANASFRNAGGEEEVVGRVCGISFMSGRCVVFGDQVENEDEGVEIFGYW